MSVSIFTRAECRAWLWSLGLKGVRLPVAGRVVYVAQPGGGVWRISPHASGGFQVEPYRSEDAQ